MAVLRTSTVTGAPGWTIRESRLHNGNTLVGLHDELGDEIAFAITDDKHEIPRLADEMLERPSVVARIGAGHTMGDPLP